jgi:ubiquinone/menaquinone biosynthesis C-methylase UbiE
MARLLKFINESEKEFWEDVYDSDEDHWTEKEVSRLTKAAVNKYGDFNNVLEIGCAAGIDTFYLAQHAKKVIGIDIVKDVINIANENLKKQPQKIRNKITFEVGDAEKLKYESSSFDFVYSLSVLHSTDFKKSLKEVRRVLSDDGNAVIYVYVGGNTGDKIANKDDFKKECKKYFDIEKENEVETKKDAGGDYHIALILFLKVK